ncbi:hypothetical protein FRC03_003903 [Tulasnella sp. 419]|nr:hypothetical protein FRC02_003199 [Tulasnella sp. 418]KAG8941862.1 hypothetical protein FRC03_003903 [Tulasnella sp. 419]
MHIFTIFTALFVSQVLGFPFNDSRTAVNLEKRNKDCPKVSKLKLGNVDTWEGKVEFVRKDMQGCVYKSNVHGDRTYILKTPALPALRWDVSTLYKLYQSELLLSYDDKSVIFPDFVEPKTNRQWLVFNHNSNAVPLNETPLYQKYGPSGGRQNRGSANDECVESFIYLDIAAQNEINRLAELKLLKPRAPWKRADFYYDVSNGYEDAVAFVTNLENMMLKSNLATKGSYGNEVVGGWSNMSEFCNYY